MQSSYPKIFTGLISIALEFIFPQNFCVSKIYMLFFFFLSCRNYVVQKVIGFKDMKINGEIASKLCGNFVSLSMNRHGSNVVEKLLNACAIEEVEQIISEMIDTPQPLQFLLNEFGNYVVQTAIKTAKAKVRY